MDPNTLLLPIYDDDDDNSSGSNHLLPINQVEDFPKQTIELDTHAVISTFDPSIE